MEHLKIDQEKCIKCNRCIQDCPMGIPCVNEKGEYGYNEANVEVCIYCGHCVAVCPVNAVSLYPIENEQNLAEMDDYGIVPFSLTPDECKRTELSNIPSVDQLESLIRSRRMVRSFKDELVDHETIEHIVKEVLCYTPTGHNSRGYEVLVVEGREKLDQLTGLSLEYFAQLIKDNSLHSFDVKVFERMIKAWEEGIDRVFRTARQAFIVHCKTSIVPADPAVKVMLTYFEMLANSMGLGTVWAGYFMVAANYKPIKDLLGIPEENSVYGAMMFGVPEFNYDYIPKRPDMELRFF